MYDNVIVPFDGGLELRAALAPAADLAWRCDAKLVVVSTTEASEERSRLVLKSQAISMSGSDIDFWVDLHHDMGEALAEAARHRPRSIVCVASRYRNAGLVRRRNVVLPAPPEVFTDAPAPVLAIGPEADVSRGLEMAELLVPHDGSAAAAAVLPLAAEWGARLRLAVRLVGLVEDGHDHLQLVDQLEPTLEELSAKVPMASMEVLAAHDPVAALVELLDQHHDAVAMVNGHGSQPPSPGLGLAPLPAELLRRAPRPLVVTRPGL
jgi:nucleotide-binding universal stress UspA family protein